MVVADQNIGMGSLSKMPDDIEKGGKNIFLKINSLLNEKTILHVMLFSQISGFLRRSQKFDENFQLL